MKKTSEPDLIAQLLAPATRRKAFEELVDAYSQPLYWQVRRMVSYHDDADDILQNTFMKAWGSMATFRGECKLSTWLYKIAYNEALTFLSRQHDTISLDSSPFDDNDEDSPPGIANTLESDTYFDGDRAALLLQQAVASLPPRQRAVFTMKYFEEMKYEDISDILGISVGALKASYHFAVRKIEDFFRRHD